MTYREPTVAELVAQLIEMPQGYPASIVVNGTLGVITGVWCQQVEPGTQATPYVLIGEQEKADAIVPPEWASAKEIPECSWPKCHRKLNPCFAWCKCPCHGRKR